MPEPDDFRRAELYTESTDTVLTEATDDLYAIFDGRVSAGQPRGLLEARQKGFTLQQWLKLMRRIGVPESALTKEDLEVIFGEFCWWPESGPELDRGWRGSA